MFIFKNVIFFFFLLLFYCSGSGPRNSGGKIEEACKYISEIATPFSGSNIINGMPAELAEYPHMVSEMRTVKNVYLLFNKMSNDVKIDQFIGCSWLCWRYKR